MKLTLNIEPRLIDQMKEVAKKRKTSISKITENIFKKEIEGESAPFRIKSRDELPQWVKDLAISNGPVGHINYKTEYHRHLEEKYGL